MHTRNCYSTPTYLHTHAYSQSRYFDCDDSDTFSENSYSGDMNDYDANINYLRTEDNCNERLTGTGVNNGQQQLQQQPISAEHLDDNNDYYRPQHESMLAPNNPTAYFKKVDNLSNCKSLSDLSTDDGGGDGGGGGSGIERDFNMYQVPT